MAKLDTIQIGGVVYDFQDKDAAREGHKHSAADITSGTLPIARGGTGATTAAAVLTNLGLTATAAELNYCDGVAYNIQTQLNEKAKLHIGASAPADTTALWIDTDDSTETGGTSSGGSGTGTIEPGLTQVFHAGTTAPSNTNLLWIDTNGSTGGLKYYNGSTWAYVPIGWAT